MKRKLLFVLIVFLSQLSFAQEIQWIVTEDTIFSQYINSFDEERISLRKGSIISPENLCYYNLEDNSIRHVEYAGKIGEIKADKVIPFNSKESLPPELKDTRSIILPYYSLNILFKSDRILFKDLFDNDFQALSWEYYTEQESYEYLLKKSYSRFLLMQNTIIDLQTNNEQSCILYIDTIKEINNGYECKGYLNYDMNNSNGKCIPFINMPQKGPHSLLILFDGDYINVYEDSKDKLLMTYVITDEKTLNEFNNLIITGNCDLSKVIWPRHADGTSPYDNLNKSAKFNFNALEQKYNNASTTVTSQTNVAVQKTMYTNCNLKLRSGEATSTQVLTVMSAGTKVKILELGKAETIDGINSNWVKVEVQKGAKDRDGKEIKAGTVGWCYGGFLK